MAAKGGIGAGKAREGGTAAAAAAAAAARVDVAKAAGAGAVGNGAATVGAAGNTHGDGSGTRIKELVAVAGTTVFDSVAGSDGGFGVYQAS